MGRVDIEALLDRVDINEIIDKVDIDGLVERTEIGSLIVRSTSGVATEALDAVRSTVRWASTRRSLASSTASFGARPVRSVRDCPRPTRPA